MMARTHDYRANTKRWGHDAGWDTKDGGKTLRAYGWGPKDADPIEVGDYILLSHSDGSGDDARYRVSDVRYEMNPRDQWFATLAFAPRTPDLKAERGSVGNE